MPVTDLHDPRLGRISVTCVGGLYQDQMTALGYPQAAREVNSLVRRVRLDETVNEAARRAEFALDGAQPELLTPITVGTEFRFYAPSLDLNGVITERQLQFFGKCFNDERNDSADDATRDYITYDICTYLARSEGFEVYAGLTATQILQEISASYDVPLGSVVDTEVPVGQIIMGPGMTYYTAMVEAFNRTYRKSGRRFLLRASSDAATIDLVEMGYTGIIWHLTDGPGGVLTRVHVSESADQLRTRLQVIQEEQPDDEPTTRFKLLAERSAAARYIETFGTLTKIVSPDNADQDQAGTDDQADFQMRQLGRTVRRMTTESLLIPGVRRGDRVIGVSARSGVNTHVSDGSAIGGFWYVDAASATYEHDMLTMTLDLVMDLADV